MFKRILTSALVFGLVAIPPPGFASAVCGPRDALVAKLGQRYAEVFKGGGFQPPDKVFEIWTSPETGTWTLLITLANKTSCIVAGGTNWINGRHLTAPAPKGVRADAVHARQEIAHES